MSTREQQEYEQMKARHETVCADPLYSFLRWDCRDILDLLYDQRISCAKAAEAIVESKLGFEPILPAESAERPQEV